MSQYFPKSSVNILEASLGEFIIVNTRKPYVGPYVAIDNGKYYAGSDYIHLGPEIVKPNSSNLDFGKSRQVKKYNLLNTRLATKFSKVKTMVPTKSIPTEKDYEKGFMARYFVERKNDKSQIFEISKKTYSDFNSKHDKSLFTRGMLTWTLEGNVRKANKLVLEKKSTTYPYIKGLFPILNEFESTNTSKNLFTSGGELYYENGREYTGPYHLHPEKGPMVGAQHVEEAHDVLVWAKDLQSPNELRGLKDLNYERLLKDQSQPQNQTRENGRTSPISDSLGTTQRSTSRTSGGGGGGY